MAPPSESPQIDESLARRLVASQFPAWANLPIAPVPRQGHDNGTFRLGNEMSVRLPRAAAYAAHMTVEYCWLPRLAPHLPVPIPEPLAIGNPEHDYPWQWLINRWIDGTEADAVALGNPVMFAREVAYFLASLHEIDAAGAPRPGIENFFRGAHLSVYDSEVRNCIRVLEERIDVQATTTVWDQALQSEWDRPPVWTHGDVAAGNLLVKEGRLCGVIDFGQLAAGDPACDIAIAWTLLSGRSREVFRDELVGIDDATWIRGRGWAVWKALVTLCGDEAHGANSRANAKLVIEDVLAYTP